MNKNGLLGLMLFLPISFQMALIAEGVINVSLDDCCRAIKRVIVGTRKINPQG